MGKLFSDEAWEQFMYWIHQNRKTADKISKLLTDIERNGAGKRIGKPEHLKHIDGWSRHIDDTNRLIYKIDDNGDVRIIACKGHYDEDRD